MDGSGPPGEAVPLAPGGPPEDGANRSPGGTVIPYGTTPDHLRPPRSPGPASTSCRRAEQDDVRVVQPFAPTQQPQPAEPMIVGACVRSADLVSALLRIYGARELFVDAEYLSVEEVGWFRVVV